MPEARATAGISLKSTARTAGSLLAHPRILMALKAAVAAALAWWIAPHVPGVAADYPYYAPLGAVVSMYPTVKASLTQGLQTLIGLTLGIALAAGVMAIGHPSVTAVAVVIGLGVLIGGIPQLGAGRDWVPMAGLFVLLIGGSDSEDYSWGYAVQMLVGIVVGLVVNFALVPPLLGRRAREQVRRIHDELADRTDDLAGVFRASWPIDGDEWEERIEALPLTLARVRAAVDQGDESSRWNPRGRRRTDVVDGRAKLATAERLAFHLRDAAEVTGRLAQGNPEKVDDRTPGSGESAALADAFSALASAIRAPEAEVAARCDAAEHALGAVWAALDARPASSARSTGEIVSVAVSAERILGSVRPEGTRKGSSDSASQSGHRKAGGAVRL